MARRKSRPALLVKLIMIVKNEQDMNDFLTELFSPAELDRAIKRLSAAKSLLDGQTFRSIENRRRVSSYVINRTKKKILNAKSGVIKGLFKSLGELDM